MTNTERDQRGWASLTRAGRLDWLTDDDRSAVQALLDEAIRSAESRIWYLMAVGNVPGRCMHGASKDQCAVAGCRARPLTPSSERYAIAELRAEVFKRDRYRCQYCTVLVDDALPEGDDRKARVDHFVPDPLGRTDMENLFTACSRCNRLKGVRPGVVRESGELSWEGADPPRP